MKCKTAILVSALFFSIPDCTHGQTKPRVVHVFVALADNQHQGIVPVPPALGNGDDPAHNLYWGAAYGVRTFFRRSQEWQEGFRHEKPFKAVLERSVFEHRTQRVLIVADAYRGSEINQAMADFLRAAAGIHLHQDEPPSVCTGGIVSCPPEDSDVVAYVGHDGLMDSPLTMFRHSVWSESPGDYSGLREPVIFSRSTTPVRSDTAALDERPDGA